MIDGKTGRHDRNIYISSHDFSVSSIEIGGDTASGRDVQDLINQMCMIDGTYKPLCKSEEDALY